MCLQDTTADGCRWANRRRDSGVHDPRMLAGLPQRSGKRLARSHDLAPGALREPHLRGALESAERWNDDAVSGETREHRLREMLSHLVEAEAPGLALGVVAGGAQRREVVVAVHFDDRLDVGEARLVGD